MEALCSSKEFLESLLSHYTYYLVNEEDKTYAWFRVTKTKYIFKVHSKKNIPFVTNPLVYEQLDTKANKFLDKEKLYVGLTKLLDQFRADNYTLWGAQDVFTNFIVGYVDDDYETTLTEIKSSCQVSFPDGKIIRYDAFLDKLSVSQMHIKGNSLKEEFLYKLWFQNPLQVKDAMAQILNSFDESDKKHFANFAELKAYVKSFKKISHKEIPDIEEILFEHIVEISSGAISELALPIPKSEFVSFDKNDIEEGRIYFWAKKKGTLKASTPIKFFVLQDRVNNYYHLSEMMLGEFNQEYKDESCLMADSDEIDILLAEVKPKSWVEISQEEVISFLTKVDASEVLNQQHTESIYYENNVLDVYENMLIHWAWGSDSEDKMYKTFFFEDTDKKVNFLKQIIAELKSYDYSPQSRKKLSEVLEFYAKVQRANELYQLQKPLKVRFLEDNPDVLSVLDKNNSRTKFMKYSPLNIIEGDHLVEGDWRLDGDAQSWIILGDLTVSGSMFFESKESFGRGHFLIVLGDVKAKNYVVDFVFSPTIFMKDVMIAETTYLLSASRSWVINIIGDLRTQTLIHSHDQVKDKQIFFEKDFSTKDEGVVKEWVKAERDCRLIFEAIVKGESLILNINRDEESLKQDRLLRSFEEALHHWSGLYYSFAGFELEALPIGEHYGHYIESDEIVRDVRQGTGLYLMNHETLHLEIVKKEKPLRKSIISSEQLAYRFFWIMWTFSDWTHRDDGPLSYWKTPTKIDEAFEKDKKLLADPHLALYWLMHFGLLEDARYVEVLAQTKDLEADNVQGAILFFEKLKKEKTFPIKIDYKENTTLFQSRIAKHKYELKKASLSPSRAIALTLAQFKAQPQNVPALLLELYKSSDWENIKKYLDSNPYEIGMSYLHIFVDGHKEKWHDKFIQEAWEKGQDWKSNYLLLDFIETIFVDLSFHNREKALTIIFNTNSLGSAARKRFTKLINWHKENNIEDKAEVDEQMRDYVATINKEKFDFQDFMDRTNALSVAGKPKFIKYCLEANLFSNKCGQGTICHYLVLYWIEELFMGSKEEKLALGRLVVEKYNLTRTHYQASESLQDSPKSERETMFKVIKKYLK